MRNAVLRLPTARNSSEQRQVLRAAIRQLERADLYLVAVEYMELNDREAQRSLDRLRSDLQSLRRYIAELRSGIRQ
jgi:hypothetical protein